MPCNNNRFPVMNNRFYFPDNNHFYFWHTAKIIAPLSYLLFDAKSRPGLMPRHFRQLCHIRSQGQIGPHLRRAPQKKLRHFFCPLYDNHVPIRPSGRLVINLEPGQRPLSATSSLSPPAPSSLERHGSPLNDTSRKMPHLAGCGKAQP